MKNNAVIIAGVIAGGAALWWYQQRNGGSAGVTVQGAADSISSAASTVIDTVMGEIGMRGIRNNNPANIRRSSTKWQGESATQTDSAFVQFVSPEYGIRALSKVLDTYSTKYSLRTVRGIISRFAPPSENNTEAYISAVANKLGVSPDEQISVGAYKAQLVAAIIKHENGINPYSVATINSGVMMA